MWCLLFTLAKLSGVFCPRWQNNVVSFVHPGKNSLVSFGSGVFCPTFVHTFQNCEKSRYILVDMEVFLL